MKTGKPSRQGFVLTSFFVLPKPFVQFQAICTAEGSTASARIRDFILREVRKAEKQAAILGE